jgi:hypothetical protein
MNIAPTDIDRKEYWSIRFEATSVEWMYLVNKLLHSITIENWNDFFIGQMENGDWVYLLNRKRYPAESVAKTFGLTSANLEKLEVLHLHPVKANPALPEPNVSYWGNA